MAKKIYRLNESVQQVNLDEYFTEIDKLSDNIDEFCDTMKNGIDFYKTVVNSIKAATQSIIDALENKGFMCTIEEFDTGDTWYMNSRFNICIGGIPNFRDLDDDDKDKYYNELKEILKSLTTGYRCPLKHSFHGYDYEFYADIDDVECRYILDEDFDNEYFIIQFAIESDRSYMMDSYSHDELKYVKEFLNNYC